jgi:N-acetylmuramoyl-L-alanine amidase
MGMRSMTGKMLLLAMTALWLMMAGMQVVEAATIKDVRLWTAPDNSRLVFDLDHSINYDLFRLHNPERIVVDMHRTRLGSSMAGLALPDPVIQDIRHGSPKPDVLRMVIDVKEQVQPRSFLLKPMEGKPYRLVIDLLRPEKGDADQTPITAQSTHKEVVIAIDAGHGGEDPGAIGPHGLKEKTVTLAVAKAMAKDIDAHPGMRAFLTRTGDYYVPLKERVRLAVKAHADLFISIHANSAPHDRRVKGAGVYMLSEKKASDKVAQILADKENAADSIGGVMPQEVEDPVVNEILVDLKKRESLNSAQMLAKDILHDLGRVGPIKYPQAKSARFMVLTEPRMPSVLVELDFISNPRRERLLGESGYRHRLARALSQASTSFLMQEGRLAKISGPQAKRVYVVKPGDNLWDIARRYGVPVADIRQTNHLDSSDLRVGQQLTLPDSSS